MGFAQLLEESKNYQGRVYTLISSLKDDEVEILKKEIESWDDKNVGLVKMNILIKNLCNLDVPVRDFQDYLKSDLRLALEVYAERVCEENNQSMAVDGFLIYLGIGSWPRYGDKMEYRKEFNRRLEEKAKELNYWMD